MRKRSQTIVGATEGSEMRKLSYGVNVLLVIAWLLGLAALLENRSTTGAGIFAFFFLLSIPAINFLALAGSGKEKDFFSLYFERKKLEQQKKIDELKKSMGEEN